MMYKNYLKIGLRTLLKHKGYSSINITGLALGMTCCLLILLYVGHTRDDDSRRAGSGRFVESLSLVASKTKPDAGPRWAGFTAR